MSITNRKSRIVLLVIIVGSAHTILRICGSLLPPFFPKKLNTRVLIRHNKDLVLESLAWLDLFQVLFSENMVVRSVQDIYTTPVLFFYLCVHIIVWLLVSILKILPYSLA